MKIQSLSRDQQKTWQAHIDGWYRYGIETSKPKRDPQVQKIKDNVKEVYRNSSLPEPEVEIFASPWAMFKAIEPMDPTPKSVSGQIWESCLLQPKRSIRENLGFNPNRLGEQGFLNSVEIIRNSILSAFDMEKNFPNIFRNLAILRGQHDASLYCSVDFCRRALGMKDETESAMPLMELAKCSGWMIATEKVCFVSMRPSFLSQTIITSPPELVEYQDGVSIDFEHDPPWISTKQKFNCPMCNEVNIVDTTELISTCSGCGSTFTV